MAQIILLGENQNLAINEDLSTIQSKPFQNFLLICSLFGEINLIWHPFFGNLKTNILLRMLNQS
jgi:hypothetical protein